MLASRSPASSWRTTAGFPNISQSLLGKLRCRNFLVSTSGAVYRHPHPRTIQLGVVAP